ncbi:hypothetical protein [Blastococcus xanthinilyticus]|uniref:SnoaL-like protein n=1 Tax=Blastococcus xanthinilyticus TaxID=1564164 RepID=A0A5S5D3A0_9ACTN|nr:hypothetical protein [Blastococcus xanthinilyticus]TYP90503.1 hypothetical protein BD833_101221 [Blastococcus xanthinilyticus]
MVKIGDITLDITQQNVAVERALAQTDNPRHRYLLQVYLRHRYLESAGRWEEILDPQLTVDVPHYRFSLAGRPHLELHGKEQVGALYKHWTDTDQAVFYVSDEQVAVGDHIVMGRGISWQQTIGSEIPADAGIDVDPQAMYLSKSAITMIWPYDDRGLLLGEDVWEFDPSVREYFELDPADVLTAEQAGELLAPYIEPIPAFDDTMLPR